MESTAYCFHGEISLGCWWSQQHMFSWRNKKNNFLIPSYLKLYLPGGWPEGIPVPPIAMFCRALIGSCSNQTVLEFFLFLHENICCVYSLEVPHWGTSNEYTQHMFPDTLFYLNLNLPGGWPGGIPVPLIAMFCKALIGSCIPPAWPRPLPVAMATCCMAACCWAFSLFWLSVDE